MKEVEIYLKDIEEGLEFCNIASKFIDDVDLNSGSISLDGKSIIGVSYIGYPAKMTAVLHSDNTTAITLFDSYMEKFINKRN